MLDTMGLNSKNRAIYERVFKNPKPSDLSWKDVETIVTSLGGIVDVKKGKTSGSRACLSLNGVKATFHKPHPDNMDKGAVKSLREFLIKAGVDSKTGVYYEADVL